MNVFLPIWNSTRSSSTRMKPSILRTTFFATLFLGLLLASCNRQSDLGAEIFEDDTIGVLVTDTFDIKVKTVVRPAETIFNQGDVIPNTQLIGSLDDPVIGKSQAEVYTQVDFAPRVFNPLAEARIDSALIVLRYDTFGVYGRVDEEVTMEVFELEERIDRIEEYTSRQRFSSNKMTPIAEHTFVPSPYDSIEVDSATSLSPRLIIPIDSMSAGWDYVKRIQALDSIFWTNTDTFRTEFPGLHFRLQAANTMLGFRFESEAVSQVQIYYTPKDTTIQERLVLSFGGIAAKTTFFEHDYEGSLAGTIMADSLTTMSDSICFLQEMQGLSPKITISGLSKLQNSLINSAELIATVKELEEPMGEILDDPTLIGIQERNDSAFVDIIDVRLATFEAQRSNSLFGYIASFGGARANEGDTTQTKYIYTAAITSHLQDAVSNQQDSLTIYISSFYQPESPRRTVFYGSETKYPIKLVVRYTKLL